MVFKSSFNVSNVRQLGTPPPPSPSGVFRGERADSAHPSLASATEPISLYPSTTLYSRKELEEMSMCFARSTPIQTSVRAALPSIFLQTQWRSPFAARMFSAYFRTLFSTLCLIPTSIPGGPIRLFSKSFRPKPRNLRVGNCIFFNMPALLRDGWTIEPQPTSKGDVHFFLEWQGVLIASDGSRELAITSQIDVTAAVQQTALSIALEKSMVVLHGNPRRMSSQSPYPEYLQSEEEEEIDWNFIADLECQRNSYNNDSDDVHNITESSSIIASSSDAQAEDSITGVTLSSYAHTPLTSRHSLEFLQAVDMIKASYIDYFVLHPLAAGLSLLGRSRNRATPFIKLTHHIVSYVSPSLYAQSIELPGYFSRAFFHQVILEHLRSSLDGNRPFELQVTWGRDKSPKDLICTPIEDGGVEGRQVRWWVCFLVDKNRDILPLSDI